MKSFSTDLFELVQALTKGEKAFFTRKAAKSATAQGKVYLKLFDLVASAKQYDEGVLLRKLKYGSDKGAFSTLKNYLYNEILQTLVEYQQNDSSLPELNRNLQILHILAGKGLTTQYLKRWNKAYKSALLYEDYPYIFILKEQLQSLKMNFVIKTDEAELNDLVREDAALFKAYSTLQEARNLYLHLQLAYQKSQIRSGKKELNPVLKLADHPVLQMRYKDQSFHFRFCYRMCHGLVNYLSHGYEQALQILEENREDIIVNYHIPASKPFMFFDFVQVYYQVCFVCKQYDRFFTLMHDPILKHFTNPDHEALLFSIHHNALLRYSLSTFRYDEALAHSAGIPKELPRHLDRIPLGQRRTLIGSMAIANFVLEQYDDAYYFCKEALSLQHQNPQEDVRQFLYLFCILIAYESKNYFVLENEIRNTYQFYYRTGKLNPFEKAMIHFLKKIMGNVDSSSRKLLFNELKALLDRFRKDPISQQVFRYFNFDAWVEVRSPA
jgi:hypothetical protein